MCSDAHLAAEDADLELSEDIKIRAQALLSGKRKRGKSARESAMMAAISKKALVRWRAGDLKGSRA